MAFFEKYTTITQKHKSYLCVGLDSDAQKLPTCVKNEQNPVLSFNKQIIDETYKYTACYKPNFAFYLAQGIQGIETLKATIDYIPSECPVILDIKAGDIGNTMEQYAKACFEYFAADAITTNILMGKDVINACFSASALPVERDNGKFTPYIFALALTSNPSADDFFKHNELYAKLALKISEVDFEKIGAVVGATQTDDLAIIRKILPQSIFLIPGIGAQGGDLAAVCRYARYQATDPRFLINSSRGIIFADNTKDFAKVAGKEAEKLQQAINTELEKYL